MRPIEKADVVFFAADLLEKLLLRLAALPEETKIPTDEQRILLFELFQARIAEAVRVAMHVAGYINH